MIFNIGKKKKDTAEPSTAAEKKKSDRAARKAEKKAAKAQQTAMPPETPVDTASVHAGEPRKEAIQEKTPIVVLPDDHPVALLAHLLKVPFSAHTTNDLYDGDVEPFCFYDFIHGASDELERLRAIPDLDLDAAAEVWISDDRLQAWLAIYPSAGNGAPLTPELVQEAIDKRGIREGLIEDAIAKAKTPDGQLHLFLIAQGRASYDGTDGENVSLIPALDSSWKQDPKGKIDFTNWEWIVNVEQGERLCRIVPPTEGEEGIDVLGKVLRAKKGRPAPKCNGKNTSFLETEDDGTFLVADSAGQLLVQGIKYSVNEVLTIKGDVDYSTGNIKSNSTVVVEGNVKPNFTVESKRDVVIRGSVEWATIIAGHDITITGGVAGGPDDYIHAGNDLRCKFMENGHASCGGDAYFENVILTQMDAEGSVYITSGRGTVVAGCITAMRDIRVNTAGNRSYRATELKIAQTKRFAERYEKCTKELDETLATIKNANANITKLMPNKHDLKVRTILSNQEAQRNMATMRADNLKARHQEMTEKAVGIKRGRVYVDTAHPNVSITIGDETWPLKHEATYATFVLRDHAIEMISQ